MRAALLSLLLLVSGSAWADGTSTSSGGGTNVTQLPVYIDISVMAGEVATTGGPTGSQANNLYEGGIGVSLALNFSGFLIGGLLEYQNLSQASTADASTGNYSGSRFFPAPMIGVLYDPVLLKIDYQMSGDWVMSNLTTNGANMQFNDPTGFRLTASYDLFSPLFVGLQYETVSFATLNRSDTGNTALAQKLTATDINLVMTYAF